MYGNVFMDLTLCAFEHWKLSCLKSKATRYLQLKPETEKMKEGTPSPHTLTQDQYHYGLRNENEHWTWHEKQSVLFLKLSHQYGVF